MGANTRGRVFSHLTSEDLDRVNNGLEPATLWDWAEDGTRLIMLWRVSDGTSNLVGMYIVHFYAVDDFGKQ